MATYQSLGDNIPTIGSGTICIDSAAWSPISINLKDNLDFLELKYRLEKIEEQLAILYPNNKLHEKYPSLKEAYDQYKLIEKLVNGKAHE